MKEERRPKSPDVDVARYAEMLTALGAESRLRIMRLLLSAHPDGMVVGDIQKELGLTASNLSHHLEKLKNEELVAVRRDGTFLWYSANAAALRELLAFLYSECCTRNRILDPDAVVHIKELKERYVDQRSRQREIRSGGTARRLR
jgi:ArsR family transcriptional regulator